MRLRISRRRSVGIECLGRPSHQPGAVSLSFRSSENLVVAAFHRHQIGAGQYGITGRQQHVAATQAERVGTQRNGVAHLQQRQGTIAGRGIASQQFGIARVDAVPARHNGEGRRRALEHIALAARTGSKFPGQRLATAGKIEFGTSLHFRDSGIDHNAFGGQRLNFAPKIVPAASRFAGGAEKHAAICRHRGLASRGQRDRAARRIEGNLAERGGNRPARGDLG